MAAFNQSSDVPTAADLSINQASPIGEIFTGFTALDLLDLDEESEEEAEEEKGVESDESDEGWVLDDLMKDYKSAPTKPEKSSVVGERGAMVLVTIKSADQKLTKRELMAMKNASDEAVDGWTLEWLADTVEVILKTHPQRKQEADTLSPLVKAALINHPAGLFIWEGPDIKKKFPFRTSFRTVFTENATPRLAALGFKQNGDATDVILIHFADPPVREALLAYKDSSLPLITRADLHDVMMRCQPARVAATDGTYFRDPPEIAQLGTAGLIGKAISKKTRQKTHDRLSFNHHCREIADEFPLKTWLARSVWTYDSSKTTDLPDPIRSIIKTKFIALFKTIQAKHPCQVNLVDRSSFNGSGQGSRAIEASENKSLQDGMTLWDGLYALSQEKDKVQRFPPAAAVRRSSGPKAIAVLGAWWTIMQKIDKFSGRLLDHETVRLTVNAIFGKKSAWVAYSNGSDGLIGPLSMHPEVLALKSAKPIDDACFQRAEEAYANKWLQSQPFGLDNQSGHRTARRDRGKWTPEAARISKPFLEEVMACCIKTVKGETPPAKLGESMDILESTQSTIDDLAKVYAAQAEYWSTRF